MKLLERGECLAQLRELLLSTRDGRGRLALVAGEAGIGKTAVVEAFCQDQGDRVQVLWGACDVVVPPRPFAPLADIAGRLNGRLRAALDGGDRDGVFDSVLAVLRERARSRLVVVFDDLHWADEATLDLLRVVGRRLREIPVLLIGTYRADEVGSEHRLRLALGDLPSGVVAEIRVPALSVAAVGVLAAGTGIDPVALHAATAGNPFFVTEAVASGADEVPATVRDAVFARIARLTAGAQEVLRAAAVLGLRFDAELLGEVAQHGAAALEECVAIGMLQVAGDAFQFRHELAQRAVREGLSPADRATLHGRALAALRRTSGADPAQLAHHALAAEDATQVQELAPAAAAWAAGLGAHREAAAHYASALRFAGTLDERSRALLLEGEARERLLIDDVPAALASQREALECWRRLGDVRREGECLRALSVMIWWEGDGDGAVQVAEQAVELLSSIPTPGPELGRAYATLAQRYLNAGHDDSVALAWAQQALGLAERLHDEAVAVHALTTIGVAQIYLGNDDGWVSLEESLRRAEAAALDEDLARALINLVETARDMRRYDLADRYRDAAIGHMNRDNVDLDLYRRRLVGALAEMALERGRWDEAADLANTLLAESVTAPRFRVKGLTVLGRLRARRGDADAWLLLDEAVALAGPRADAEVLFPLGIARVEAAWLDGNWKVAGDEAQIGLTLAEDLVTDPWVSGELWFWAWKAGHLDQLPEGCAEPYALHAAGHHREAAAAWRTIGCPYQQAMSLADSSGEEDQRLALEIFQSLGARPMARKVTAQLRGIGARAIPRGPRQPTRANPARLTARELEVLTLVAQGLGNAEVAERLVVSAKTVDHHVSSILRKLGVPNRTAAAREASRLGLKDGEISVQR